MLQDRGVRRLILASDWLNLLSSFMCLLLVSSIRSSPVKPKDRFPEVNSDATFGADISLISRLEDVVSLPR